MNKLDQEEREILEAFESGNVQRSKDAVDTQRDGIKNTPKPCSRRTPGSILGSPRRIFVAYRRKPWLKAFHTKRSLPVFFTSMLKVDCMKNEAMSA